ncbi:DNA packaging terminase subunit 2 [Saimiriine alphaherpesvirus 1]|uniref:DNA packaging terminase subunit 2 n=1 Tax=Saimiriine herpesvirus 1 (strain MV-5-4-PSL) TaxID=10353 RepID=E2IUE1_SHV1|nr:DNA packaging terminase subunit 2 [Saimiriine alphaherpesvirus 1]ADO13799.1 DNA packaging terminase subunit 2 [Saimiriine alphaherpesvirus 1]
MFLRRASRDRTTPSGARASSPVRGGSAAAADARELSHAALAAPRRSAALQKLLALVGQVQTYTFQIELLKRCDPRVGVRKIPPLKHNALQVRVLTRRLRPGLVAQADALVTPASLILDLSLAYARREGERLLAELEAFAAVAASGDAAEDEIRKFFARTMSLSGPCAHHHRVHLETYGGGVDMELCFLHDAENLLKQINYCHLITPPAEAAVALERVWEFLSETVGAGFVVPPEISDPSHPCSVCFEELCATANQGASLAHRLADRSCDHITQQARVRLDDGEIARYLPHAAGVSAAARRRAAAVLERASAAPDGSSRRDRGDACAAATLAASDALLEEHHVFRAASRGLYAVSELRFWLASGDRSCASTIDAFVDNLTALAEREARQEVSMAAVEMALFGRSCDHFDRAFGRELATLDTVDALMVGGQASSPDDQIQALIRACYDHHMSAPLIRRLVDPRQGDEEALRRVLMQLGRRPQRPRTGGERGGDASGEGASRAEDAGAEESPRDDEASGLPGESDRRRPDAIAETGGAAWAEVAARASEDARERRRLYADRLTKRSLASLGRCVREQRGELEKMLRVSVYGELLPVTYAAVYNGFVARRRFRDGVAAAGTVVDNRSAAETFDAHRFMRASLLRHQVDPAMLPSLTHKFFELVNGPMFDHHSHSLAQPPNTALYYSVENVGLLPHLKEELAHFMMAPGGGSRGAKGVSKGGAADWAVSEFQRFYCFCESSGITPTQRAAWGYIRELIVATTLFVSVFRCGAVELRRPDHARPDPEGVYRYPPGLYLTYDSECPLVAIVESDPEHRITDRTVVIYDRDVFSILYSILQHLAPKLLRRDESPAD